MRLDKFLIGMVLFSLFMIGGSIVIGNVVYNYNVQTNTSDGFSNVYSNITAMYNISDNIEDSTLQAELEGGDESWESMTKGSYQGVRGVTGSFSLFGNIINTLAIEVFNVPPAFVTATMIILIISIGFAVVYLIFRHTPPD